MRLLAGDWAGLTKDSGDLYSCREKVGLPLAHLKITDIWTREKLFLLYLKGVTGFGL